MGTTWGDRDFSGRYSVEKPLSLRAQIRMGIDNIYILKPPPHTEHDPATCEGRGVCLTCTVRALQFAVGPEK